MTRRVPRGTRLVHAAILALMAVGCRHDADSSQADGGSSNLTRGPSGADTAASAWSVTPTGWGPIRVGMTVSEARAAFGGDLGDPQNRECDHLRPSPAPAGVLLMVVQGEVARVEVNDTTVATAEGARVGVSEARIRALYPGRVRSVPHKYVDGHYLIVPRGAGADTIHRLVFETDGQRVTRFRSGRVPEVEWVEGCG